MVLSIFYIQLIALSSFSYKYNIFKLKSFVKHYFCVNY
jgi:hypothetical protein